MASFGSSVLNLGEVVPFSLAQPFWCNKGRNLQVPTDNNNSLKFVAGDHNDVRTEGRNGNGILIYY